MAEMVNVGPPTVAWAARVLENHFFDPRWLGEKLGVRVPVEAFDASEVLPFDRQLTVKYVLLPALAGVSVASLARMFPQLFIHIDLHERARWFTTPFKQNRWLLLDQEPGDETCGQDLETALHQLEPGERLPTPLMAAYLAVAYHLKGMFLLFQEKRTVCRERASGRVLAFGGSLVGSYGPNLTFFPFTHWDTRIGIAAWQTWSANPEAEDPY